MLPVMTSLKRTQEGPDQHCVESLDLFGVETVNSWALHA